MKAEILCVGTELLLGDIVNTNAVYLAKELAKLGINVYHQAVVGDNPERLKASLKEALSRCDLVITTGGLGPTCDDLTKETAAEVLGLPMEENAEELHHIKEYFQKINRTMTDNNRKQALIPKGAVILKNGFGTAPGILAENNGKFLALLPGPPREMRPMFDNELAPILKKYTGKTLVSRTIHIFNVGESSVESKLKDLMNSLENPTLAPYAKDGEVLLRVTAAAESTEKGYEMIEPVIEKVREIIGNEYIYGIDVGNLQTALVKALHSKNLKIATADRVLILPAPAEEKTIGGICSYSNNIKHSVLGVSQETLDTFTEYSAETALEMAKGVRRISGADIGISTTGIAGPNGGTDEKPVGLVYVAVDSDNYSDVKKLLLSRGFSEERELIRYLASSHALYMGLTATKRL